MAKKVLPYDPQFEPVALPMHRIESMLANLRAAATLGGNLSDEALESRSGPNDSVMRGIMYTGARSILRATISSLEGYKASAMFSVGRHVSIKVDPAKVTNDWTDEALASRKSEGEGVVIEEKNAHGQCFRVQHDDGSIGVYDPHELQVNE